MWTPVDESGACVRYAPFSGENRAPYEEFTCLYPTLGKTYFQWEYPPSTAHRILEVVETNAWVPIAAVVLYAMSIWLGQRYMSHRPAWDWRKTMAIWNLVLSLFSTMGFLRMAPHLIHNLLSYDWKDNLCTNTESLVGMGSTGYWGLLFALSKFVELFDMFFIVIHKKQLLFLHWYHHITVLLCCWHTIASQTPTGMIFSVVNYGVHSIMYFYYFLMAIRCKPKWFHPQVITMVQIMQMVVGVTVCLQAWKYSDEEDCFADTLNIKGTLLMYASYLYLFVEFFFQRYGIRATTSTSFKRKTT